MTDFPPMPVPPPTPSPNPPPTGPQGIRACATARAWQQGTRLARLLIEHDVPPAAEVWTRQYPNIGERGLTHLSASMAAASDLFRLAYRTGAELHACATSMSGAEQACINLGHGQDRAIRPHWSGPLSTAAGVRERAGVR